MIKGLRCCIADNQFNLVDKLKTAVGAVKDVIALERYYSHNPHPNKTYSKILQDLVYMLDAETALLRQPSAIGR